MQHLGFACSKRSSSVHLGVRDRAKVDDGKFDSILHRSAVRRRNQHVCRNDRDRGLAELTGSENKRLFLPRPLRTTRAILKHCLMVQISPRA